MTDAGGREGSTHHLLTLFLSLPGPTSLKCLEKHSPEEPSLVRAHSTRTPSIPSPISVPISQAPSSNFILSILPSFPTPLLLSSYLLWSFLPALLTPRSHGFRALVNQPAWYISQSQKWTQPPNILDSVSFSTDPMGCVFLPGPPR